MQSKSKIVQFIIALLFLIGMASSADSTKAVDNSHKEPKHSTPQLIKSALKKGEIDSNTMYLYLAYALLNDTKIPNKYHGDVPYDGTTLIRELSIAFQKNKMTASVANQVADIIESFCDTYGYSDSYVPLSNSISTDHFYIEYEEINGGLNINDYVNALEISWNTMVDKTL